MKNSFFKNNKIIILLMISSLVAVILFSSKKIQVKTPVQVGVWEFFDAKVIPPKNLYTNTNEIAHNNIDDDKDGYIDNIHGIGFDYLEQPTYHNFYPDSSQLVYYFHGTGVAEVILRNNPDVEIAGCGFLRYVERIYDSTYKKNLTERLQSSEIKDANLVCNMLETSLRYYRSINVKVVNISWMASYDVWKEILPKYNLNSPAYYQKMKKWTNLFHNCLTNLFKEYKDIFFVIAAGNDGADVDESFVTPSKIDLPNTITVGGLQKDGKTIAPFSNYGKNVIAYATAEYDSLLVLKNKNGSYIYMFNVQGTSFAAPVVTAYVAKLIAKGYSFEKIKAHIRKKKYFISPQKTLY